MAVNKTILLLLLVALNAPASAQLRNAYVDSSMLNRPAPAFSLRDLDGHAVSLSDYKGKVLVLDFWATWCRPCRMSFPAMQMLMDKYKADPDVRFLFVDTREKSDTTVDLARKILAENHYTFPVALDQWRDGANKDKVLKEFGGQAIPLKLVIDKQGVVRFLELGYNPNGAPEDFVSEFSEQIEQVRRL